MKSSEQSNLITGPGWKSSPSGGQESRRPLQLIAATFQSHGQRSLGGYSLCGHKDLDMN